MKYPVANYKEKWYDAQPYGSPTSYGYHEGADINLKSGGNTDLGQPLYAIADGVVSSIHNHTTANTFGNHLHIQHDGPWGSVWSHYAHCQSLVVKVGQSVKEGDLVGYLGKSGTTLAHLHFCIKLMPTGIDAIARTKEDLAKWTDPILFIEKWAKAPTQNMSDERPYWFDLMNKVIWNRPYEELTLEMVKGFVTSYPSQLARSGEYDKIVIYMKGDANIDTNTVSAQDLINIVGGLRGDAKRAREEAEVALTEVRNREEQVSRLKDQLLKTEETIAELSKPQTVLLSKIAELQGLVDTYAKDKGELAKELAKCKVGNETAKKNLIQKVIEFINSIWRT